MAEGPDQPTRRAAPRVGCVLRLQYRSTGHLLVSYCTNLSRGGLFVASDTPLPHGAHVTLRVDVPGADAPQDLNAIVRWTRMETSEDGPPGMGLSFEGVDTVLGDRIDRIVSEFSPLLIEIVGAADQTWQHVAALARSLVTCDTHNHTFETAVAPDLSDADLVVVDVDAQPGAAMDLLQALGELDSPAVVLALVAGNSPELQAAASQFAHVVRTPVDKKQLQRALLERLAHVDAHQE